jgi:hypothetical protein
MGLLALMPIFNVIVMFKLAFGSWPVLKELEALRKVSGQSKDRFDGN